MKQTWTGLPEIKDPAPRPCTIEEDQVEYLQQHLGLERWAMLQEMEEENARINV